MEMTESDYKYCVFQTGMTCSGFDKCGECIKQTIENECEEMWE